MKRSYNIIIDYLKQNAGIFLLFIPGVVVLVHTFGLSLSRFPGNLGDSRMIWYVLEHFFLWISGSQSSFWDAPFFYPYRMTIAFSDALLGSAPIYALFRLLGIGKYTSYQLWLILGYTLNYFVAAFVLVKLRLKPIAAGAGAFFFAFGLPILAQEFHLQLLYRFCVPLAFYLLWKFSQQSRLLYFPLMIFFVVWQFYIAIYTGFFLVIFLAIMVFVIPLSSPEKKDRNPFRYWTKCFNTAFRNGNKRSRVLMLASSLVIISLLVLLMVPYMKMTQIYGFSKPVDYVISMFPRPVSFFLADGSQIWKTSNWITEPISHRWEQQLSPGLAVYLLLLIGIIWNFKNQNRRFAWINIMTVGVVILLTTYNNEFSIYQYLLRIPIFTNIRTLARIHLVSMWPLAVFISIVLDSLLRKKESPVNFRGVSFLIIIVLIMESLFFTHPTYTKDQALSRLTPLYEQLEENDIQIKENSILYVGEIPGDEPYYTDVDGMWLGQELGIPTLNGMTSNFPDGKVVASTDCNRIDDYISHYMQFAGIEDNAFRDDLFSRLIILNMDHCDFSID